MLEPFGHDLADLAFQGVDPDTIKKYVYFQLYDSIKVIAQTYPNLNRYELQGTVKELQIRHISWRFNIPPGSVTVTAGGQTLQGKYGLYHQL